jgi:hypothetical protein
MDPSDPILVSPNASCRRLILLQQSPQQSRNCMLIHSPGSISEAASHDGRVGVQLTGWMEAQNHRHHPQGVVTSRSSRPMRSHRRPLDTLTRPAIIPLILAVSNRGGRRATAGPFSHSMLDWWSIRRATGWRKAEMGRFQGLR